jgi:predicted phosphodiesterase
LQRILFVPDSHIPYHDKRAWELMLKAAGLFKPDQIVLLGDFADCYAVSSHDKSPGRKHRLQWELDEVDAALADLERLEAKKKVYIFGNHEDRLDRYIATRAPELDGLLSIPAYLELKERGWIQVPYKDSYRIGKLWLTHDTGKAGKNAIAAALDDYQSNIIIGHVHRMGVVYGGDATGKTHVAASFGWLGDARSVDYMHRVKVNRDWQLGFGLGYLLPNGTVHIVPVPIVNGQCVVEGQLVKSGS